MGKSNRKEKKAITVLMADNDPDDRKLTKGAFEENQFHVDLRFVKNGNELLDYLLRNGEYEKLETSPRPKLILLDLNMPKKSGLQAIREIRNEPDLKNIPIVIWTTSDSKDDMDKAQKLGADSFITKPMEYSNVLDAIKSLEKYLV
jgi:CheY-like chemotaxis protein